MFPPPPTPCSLPQYAIHFLVVCLALPQFSPHCFQVVFVPRCVCTSAVSVTLGREDTISPTSPLSHLALLPPPGYNCLSRPSPLLLPSCVRPAPCRLQLSACLWTVTLGSEATISGAAGREFCPRGRTSAVPALSSTSHCPLFPVDFPSLFIVRVFFRSCNLPRSVTSSWPLLLRGAVLRGAVTLVRRPVLSSSFVPRPPCHFVCDRTLKDALRKPPLGLSGCRTRRVLARRLRAFAISHVCIPCPQNARASSMAIWSLISRLL